MYSTFELESRVANVMESLPSPEYRMETLGDEYAKLADIAIDTEERYYALLSAVELSKDKENICAKASEELTAYRRRNTTDEQLQMLKEYGCMKDVMPLTKEQAYALVDEGLPVLMLNRDNTVDLVRFRDEIDKHMENGGIVGASQFTVDRYESLALDGELLGKEVIM